MAHVTGLEYCITGEHLQQITGIGHWQHPEHVVHVLKTLINLLLLLLMLFFVQWGGRNIAAGSNIVFSNGLLDPWHGGGVLEDVSRSLTAVVIPEVGDGAATSFGASSEWH